MPNICPPILSNVSESTSRLFQHKPVSNVKHVSVQVSPVYASSFSEVVKPLNVSKPVCSSNATKRNDCNTISVSRLFKPLNLSKPVFSSNTTKYNICNTSSVCQFLKPLNVGKPVYSNNATESSVCKVSSVSQPVKTSIVIILSVTVRK